jgi:hypothetical protein
MKSGCQFELLFEGYFKSDLSPAEELALLNHLKTCEKCRVQLDDFYKIHTELLKSQRPSVPSELKDSYYKQVDLNFGQETLSEKINVFLSSFSRKHSPIVRTIQIATFIIIGLIVGWIIFSPAEPQIIYQSNDPYQMSQPVSQVDIDFLYTYLVVTEMVLLEMHNSTDFYLNKDQAQELLIKTFRVNDIALQLNNLRIINFLNRMELLLHEASNINEEDIEDSLVIIRKVIDDYDLLREVEDLKLLFAETKEQFGT